jgi:HK97 family phage portal protein
LSLFGYLFGTGGSTTHHSGLLYGGGYPTESGSQISEYNAPTIPAVYACVGLISDAIAQLPIRVYRMGDNGRREHIRGHRVEHLLNERPNPRMTAFAYRKTAMNHVLLWGNGYSHIQRRGNGTPEALWLALPDRTWPELQTDGSLIYETTIDQDFKEIEAPDMVHVPAFGFDGVVGYSPVAVARQAMGLSKAMEKFGAKFYANDGTSGGYIKHPGKLSEEAVKNLRESLSRQGGPDEAWRPKVLEEGMDYVQTTINPEDAQFLEGRDFQVAEIARIYRVPLHMIQSVSGSTSWGSGIAEMSMGFVRFTLAPWMTPIEQELNNKLFTRREREQGYYIKHDTSDLLRGDLNDRANYYQAALDPENGWLTREEVRAAEDKDPLENDDSRFATVRGAE